MKIEEYAKVHTTVDIQSGFSDRVIPAGTVGVVVDVPPEDEPEIYSVDVVDTEGNNDHIEVRPEQLALIQD